MKNMENAIKEIDVLFIIENDHEDTNIDMFIFDRVIQEILIKFDKVKFNFDKILFTDLSFDDPEIFKRQDVIILSHLFTGNLKVFEYFADNNINVPLFFLTYSSPTCGPSIDL